MPETVNLLKHAPLYQLNDNPYEVFFSLLKPGQHIKPHFGLSNHSLTVHLPIIVPGNGHLRVGEKKNEWQEGKLIVFDDSFEHEAINNAEDIRVVLIFSIWHPDLSEIEKQDIKSCFSARTQWLTSRSEYIT
jgi:aspartyl/asparaginyl beta-hydroxylase (cupin superfamily)